MSDKNGAVEAEEEVGDDDTSQLISDPKERKDAGKRLFAAFFEARKERDELNEKVEAADAKVEEAVKEIYFKLGKRKYDVKGENLTPTKRKQKNGESFSFFMRSQREMETEKI